MRTLQIESILVVHFHPFWVAQFHPLCYAHFNPFLVVYYIRFLHILDKFVEDCADVIGDDGLSFGQRTPEGYLEPQVKVPGAPIFPEDVDWKSIEHEL
ncbi:hypothetical protein [Sinomicrobium weinanense]|uniref:Uncharacterized protein n=1 Tax=Sinomicrobium weinanense TaxID=2842200 RepID=A0A926JP86_9FLAO|nr:hypothetical protein [Sinomicrobium weinanense]MBC9794945.1 hypothetical protein [Sinomicrobium weinanense]MBU3125716.1 hypothetical protein [Sinomicrobium weinanense]